MDGSAAPTPLIPRKPRLKPWYRLASTDSGLVLRYAGSVLEFNGEAAVRLLPHLLPLLDGTRSVAEISDTLGPSVRPAVDHALDLLASRRLLSDGAPDAPAVVAATADFLSATDRYGCEPLEALAGLEQARAAVVGSSRVARLVEALLQESGVDTRPAEWDDAVHGAGLAVVAPTADELSRVPDWNTRALEHRSEWLPVLPFDGQLAAVGPLVVPYESACHACYLLRRSANISPLPDDGSGHHPGMPALDAAVAGLTATTALRRLALRDGGSVGVLLSVEAGPELTCSRHVVYRVPRCPACSPSASHATPAPWHSPGEERRAA